MLKRKLMKPYVKLGLKVARPARGERPFRGAIPVGVLLHIDDAGESVRCLLRMAPRGSIRDASVKTLGPNKRHIRAH